MAYQRHIDFHQQSLRKLRVILVQIELMVKRPSSSAIGVAEGDYVTEIVGTQKRMKSINSL